MCIRLQCAQEERKNYNGAIDTNTTEFTELIYWPHNNNNCLCSLKQNESFFIKNHYSIFTAAETINSTVKILICLGEKSWRFKNSWLTGAYAGDYTVSVMNWSVFYCTKACSQHTSRFTTQTVASASCNLSYFIFIITFWPPPHPHRRRHKIHNSILSKVSIFQSNGILRLSFNLLLLSYDSYLQNNYDCTFCLPMTHIII